MFELDLLSFIPQRLKQKALDTLVNFVSAQAKRFVSDEIATKIQKLRSDAAFHEAFEAGLRQAARRFVQEYEIEDEDLVAAIAQQEGFFENREVQDALLAMLKQPSICLVEERATVARSFATVLPHRKNRDRVDRAVMYLLQCLAQELWHLPELRPLYSLQFQRMTAEATRQQVALQKKQLQALNGLNTGVREALLQLTDAIAERKSLPASGDFPALPAPPHIYHNLPQPDYGTFIGRKPELARIHRTLRPYPHSREHLITIDGIGGIGKSALALEVSHRYLRDYDRLPEEERFEAIVWTSAKAEVLTANGVEHRQQVTRTLGDIYTTLAVTLAREDITRVRPEEQDELVAKALTQQRTLLIVDNLETVDDERVNTFLRELPAPTKAIVTTRHRIDVAYPIRLTGMSQEEGLALIAQECAKKGVALSAAEVEKLYDRTGGVPLAIVWSVALAGFGHPVKAVLRRLGQPSGDIARFCFKGALQRVRGDSLNLLVALSLFATDASREALGHVAGLGMDMLSRDEGLVTLGRLSLINKQADRFSLLPLTRAYLSHESERMPEFVQDALERMLAYYKQIASPPQELQVGVSYWDGMMHYGLEGESANLVHLVRWALAQGRDVEVLELFLLIVHHLHRWGLWDERLRLSRKMCQVANKLGDSSEAWLWIDAIGFILCERQQFSEAIQAFKRGRLSARQFGLADALILADTFEARLYLSINEISYAQKRLESILEYVSLEELLKHGSKVTRIVMGRVVSLAALLSLSQRDFPRSRELYERRLTLARSTGEMVTPVLSRLAHVSLELGEIDAAEKYIVQALATAVPKDMSWINYRLAMIAEKKGEWEEARHLGISALEQFSRLGHKIGAQECENLLARLPPR